MFSLKLPKTLNVVICAFPAKIVNAMLAIKFSYLCLLILRFSALVIITHEWLLLLSFIHRIAQPT